MSEYFEKVANAMDKLADILDAQDVEKLAAVNAEREVLIDKIASAQEMSSETREKLAGLDTELLEELAARTESLSKEAAVVDSMGEPATIDYGSRKASTPEDRFASWILE